jgi:spore coat protein CotH
VSTLKANVNEVWELIDSLTLEEKRIIYKKMEQEIGTKLLDILDKVNERAEKDSISLEEITKEVEDVRGYLYEED